MTLLFTSTHETPFIAEDLLLLRRHYEVRRLLTNSLRAPIDLLIHLCRADLCFIWFASVYAAIAVFLAGFLGRKSIVVIGGADVARVDDAGYGQWRSPWKSLLTGYALRRAWRVIAVDDSLRIEARRRADYPGENIEVVPTGYDPEFWRPGTDPRLPRVLTVAACTNISRLKVKGIPVLCQAARLLPDVEFTIIGTDPGLALRSGIDVPSNVRMLPRAGRESLLTLYQQAPVYCQPSLFEGLPNSVCEAMLCGCFPVATDVGGSAFVIGDAGSLVPPRDPVALARALALALARDRAPDTRGRLRIMELFPLGKREEALVELIESAFA